MFTKSRAAMRRVDWDLANKIAQTLMHTAMVFFFVSLGIVTLKVIPVVKNVDATVTDARRVILSIGGTAAQLRQSSQDEAKQIAEVTRQAKLDLTTLNTDLTSLNTVINAADDTVTTLTSTAGTANEQISKIGPVLDETKKAVAQTTTTVAAAQPVLNNLNDAASGMAKVANDPAIHQTLQNAATMTGDGAAVTTHYKNIILKPVSKLKAGLMTAGRVVSWFVKIIVI